MTALAPLPPLPPQEGFEISLDELWPNEWQRLGEGETTALRRHLDFAFAWRLDVPRSEHHHPRVDHLLLLIDGSFPFSDIRVCAPQADGTLAQRWPHVEQKGLFCLPARPLNLPIRRRIALAVSDAVKALRLDESARDNELRREVLSYWERETSGESPSGLALFPPAGPSRAIVYAKHRGLLIFADSAEQLSSWLRNGGVSKPADPLPAWLAMLEQALTPGEYPVDGAALFQLAGRDNILPLLAPPDSLPVVFGMPTPTGPVFAGAWFKGPARKALFKGFRDIGRLPAKHVSCCYSGQSVWRFKVERADRAWVHGRDKDPSSDLLAQKTVALIGCGALGSELARLLAQSGVGRFILIDRDRLAPQNTSRHLLGAADVGRYKTDALSDRLRRDFPHLGLAQSIPRRFEQLEEVQLASIANADLVISAGVPLSTDTRIDRWRKRVQSAQPWLISWTEEFALAGHAVLLSVNSNLIDLFDDAGKPKRRMTSNWPNAVATLAEAGCGNFFQPYGATDLHGTTGLAARLALDSLLGHCEAPAHRVWLGGRDRAIALGATVSDDFNASMTERVIPWP